MRSYETTRPQLWTELVKKATAGFEKSGTEGKCIESRELSLPYPKYSNLYEPDKLFTAFYRTVSKEKYGVECVSALQP